jgi:hypothetical protein
VQVAETIVPASGQAQDLRTEPAELLGSDPEVGSEQQAEPENDDQAAQVDASQADDGGGAAAPATANPEPDPVAVDVEAPVPLSALSAVPENRQGLVGGEVLIDLSTTSASSRLDGYRVSGRAPRRMLTFDAAASGRSYRISQSGASNFEYISITQAAPVDITLAGVSLLSDKSSTGSPLRLSSGSDLRLHLVGSNLLSGEGHPGKIRDNSGISVPAGCSLTIDGKGVLQARGGVHSAGIGVGPLSDERGTTLGNITINGGTVLAEAGLHGAGIGCGWTSPFGGQVTINGGTVLAQARYYLDPGDGQLEVGAAIGGAYDGAHSPGGCRVVITGGYVQARGFGGAGIGSGAGIGGSHADPSEVYISGGEVHASSANGGAAIGGGGGSIARSGGVVGISGGKVEAISRGSGAGIGAGGTHRANGHPATVDRVLISGGEVTARSEGDYGIGGGSGGVSNDQVVARGGSGWGSSSGSSAGSGGRGSGGRGSSYGNGNGSAGSAQAGTGLIQINGEQALVKAYGMQAGIGGGLPGDSNTAPAILFTSGNVESVDGGGVTLRTNTPQRTRNGDMNGNLPLYATLARVQDGNGVPLAGALVRIPNLQASGYTWSGRTDANGEVYAWLPANDSSNANDLTWAVVDNPSLGEQWLSCHVLPANTDRASFNVFGLDNGGNHPQPPNPPNPPGPPNPPNPPNPPIDDELSISYPAQMVFMATPETNGAVLSPLYRFSNASERAVQVSFQSLRVIDGDGVQFVGALDGGGAGRNPTRPKVALNLKLPDAAILPDGNGFSQGVPYIVPDAGTSMALGELAGTKANANGIHDGYLSIGGLYQGKYPQQPYCPQAEIVFSFHLVT